VAEELLDRFNKVAEDKRRALEQEISRAISEALSKRKSEILYTRDKALKQIMQLLKPGT